MDKLGQYVRIAYSTTDFLLIGSTFGILDHSVTLQDGLRELTKEINDVTTSDLTDKNQRHFAEALAFRINDQAGKIVGGFTLSPDNIGKVILQPNSITFLMPDYSLSVYDE